MKIYFRVKSPDFKIGYGRREDGKRIDGIRGAVYCDTQLVDNDEYIVMYVDRNRINKHTIAGMKRRFNADFWKVTS